MLILVQASNLFLHSSHRMTTMISKFIAVAVSLLSFLQAAQQEEPVCCGGSVKVEQPAAVQDSATINLKPSRGQIRILESNCVKTASNTTVTPGDGDTIKTDLMHQDVQVAVSAILSCANTTPPVTDTCKFCICWKVERQGSGGSWLHYFSTSNVQYVNCGDTGYLYISYTTLQAILPGTYRVTLDVNACDAGNGCNGTSLANKQTTFTITGP